MQNVSKKLLIFSLLISLWAFMSCDHGHEKHAHEAVKYPVTTAILQDTSVIKEYVCQIHAYQHIELRALESGYLEDILVDEGQTVQKGQLLFQIMPTFFQAELKEAEAEAKMAEVEYLNTKALADSNIVSPNELAIAEARQAKVQAKLQLAKAHLGFTEIRAPFSGLVGRFHVRLGSLPEEGELLTTLSDNSQMWVYFNVPEAEYLDFKMRAKATDAPIKVKLRMANDQEFAHTGVITALESDFNSETGNIAFRATFPNPEGLLRHGETGNILMTESLKNAMLIPQKATYEVLDKKFVFVVTADGTVQAREIQIAAELPHLYAVSGGLSLEDKILLEGLRKVRNNDKIEFEHQAPEEVFKSLELHAE